MNYIPYGKQYIDDEDIHSVTKTLKSDFLTTGPKVIEFEKSFSKITGAKYCVSVSNGTAALHLSSLCLLEQKDKVLTTPNSFLATSNSILYVKAKPIFVDICKDGNIDLELCEEELKKDPSIKAIYVVHFSGKMVDQQKLKYLRKKYKLKILEDCAHSLGAYSKGVRAGSCKNSDISIFSFHPVKNITAGEGGIITTNSKKYYKKLLLLRNHGMKRNLDIAPWHYDMTELGFNYRLTDIACALAISQLKKLDFFLDQRRKISKIYEKAFSKIDYINPLYSFDKGSSYHLFVLKIEFEKYNMNKKDFVLKMKENNIGLQYHYIPINKQPFYKKIGFGKEKTPVMDEYFQCAISLPIYPSLKRKEQAYVIEKIKEILNV